MTWTDPISALRRRAALTTALGLTAIAAAVGWSFLLPVEVLVPQVDIAALLDSAPADMQLDHERQGQLDPHAFDVHLWNPAPGVQPTLADADPAPPLQPPPLRLVGIINDEGVLRAALYDLEQDKLFIVRHGEVVRDCIVERIDLAAVILQQGDHVHELRLKEDRS
jgi:hypothetical protein